MSLASSAGTRASRRGGAARRRSSRLLRRLLVVAVLVLLAVWLAAAWYFSDVVYEDGLRVTPPPLVPVTDVEVRGVEDGSITLVPGDNQAREVSAPGRWGLWWDDGYGWVTDIEATSGEEVTRDFTRLHGTGPDVGALADVDKYVYGDTPDEVLGLAWEEVVIATPLGTQDAWFVPAGDDGAPSEGGTPEAEGTWAVLVHGKGSDRDEMLRMLRTVHEVGMSALVITYRGDRGQPVDPSGVYRFGATEWEDLDAAVGHALDEGATDVVLLGASTGAALIGAWFDRAQDTETASGIVVDSPNADLEQTFAHGASQRTIPGTGWPLPPGLAWTAFRIAEARFPVDFSAVDYSDTLAAVDVPTLVFHGSGDLTVPVEAARDVVADREAAGLPTTYVETDAGEHVGSYNHDPDGYAAALAEFLRAVP